MRDVVSNTSPLLYLHQLGLLDLLRSMYSKVLVPRSVAEELDVGRGGGYDVPDVRAAGWMEVVSSPTLSLLALATDLGKGESEAIAAAHERRALLIKRRLPHSHAGSKIALTGSPWPSKGQSGSSIGVHARPWR